MVRNIFVDKKAISPIVATVILVGFVVLIIVLIWIWSGDVYREQVEKEGALANEQLKCNDVAISIERVTGTIYVRNTGSRTINGFRLREELPDGLARVSDIYTEVLVGETFPLIQSDVDCGSATEPDAPGSLCNNAESVGVTPALQPIGRGAPLVECINSREEVNL